MNRWFERESLVDLDFRLACWMDHWGHRTHRITLAIVFLWFGALKISGHSSASSLIAHTIYFSSPEVMVPILGAWEMGIGLCLIVHPLIRVALLLLAIRLPGIILALLLKADVCFMEFPWVPSLEGQYLIKDFLLFGAALVIGGTVRTEK